MNPKSEARVDFDRGNNWERRQWEEHDYEAATSSTVPHLLRQLTSEVTTLFSKEVSLARAEVRETVHGIKAGVISMLTGSIVLLAGVIVLLMAAVYGLATMMDLWLAALIVGGAVTAIGLIMVTSGKNKLDADALKPHRTVDSIREDREALKDAIKGGQR
ncbi:MAG TPA: phage holin family protein [Pseudomonadales bacterium]